MIYNVGLFAVSPVCFPLTRPQASRVCDWCLALWQAPPAFNNHYILIYSKSCRTWRLVPNLPTRSLLAISAALTPSAALVPARITAKRGKKAKTSAREFSLSNKRNVIWMMQALCTGPRGLCWPGHSGIWVGPEIGYRAKFSALCCSQGLKLNILWICSSSPSLLSQISMCMSNIRWKGLEEVLKTSTF